MPMADRSGFEALCPILDWSNPAISIRDHCGVEKSAFEGSLTSSLLEATRRLDEQQATSASGKASSAAPPAVGGASPPAADPPGRHETRESSFEGIREAVLKGLDDALIRHCRVHPEIPGEVVLRILKVLIASYTAEIAGQPAKPVTTEGSDEELRGALQYACERWLGRAPITVSKDDGPYRGELNLPVVVLCLNALSRTCE